MPPGLSPNSSHQAPNNLPLEPGTSPFTLLYTLQIAVKGSRDAAAFSIYYFSDSIGPFLNLFHYHYHPCQPLPISHHRVTNTIRSNINNHLQQTPYYHSLLLELLRKAAMDRFTSKDLMDSPKRVTRYNMREHQSKFPFLLLAPELRNMVYKYATTDPQQFADFWDKYYERLTAVKSAKKRVAYSASRYLAPPTKKAPNVFFINKQIFLEASYLFYHSRRTISFHHGMLDIQQIGEVLSPQILQRMTSISITDAGHDQIIQLDEPGIRKSLPCSWNGYMRLLKLLGDSLSTTGHNLKQLTIDFSRDKKLGEHLVGCWNAPYLCGFREQFREALDTFDGVRGVGCVTLRGFNPVHAAELKKRMESKPVQFSHLPENVRGIIFSKALGFEDISHSIFRAIEGRPEGSKKKRFPYPNLATPTVLLLNKKYSAEAFKILHESKKLLRFVLPARHNIVKPADMPKLSRFIGRDTLQTVQAIEITMDSRDWLVSLDRDFVSALKSNGSQLQSFTLTFTDDRLYQQYPVYPDRELHHHIGKRLCALRGLQVVKFFGTLPLCYTDPLATIMTTRSRVIPQLRGIYLGTLVVLEDNATDHVATHHVAR